MCEYCWPVNYASFAANEGEWLCTYNYGSSAHLRNLVCERGVRGSIGDVLGTLLHGKGAVVKSCAGGLRNRAE